MLPLPPSSLVIKQKRNTVSTCSSNGDFNKLCKNGSDIDQPRYQSVHNSHLNLM